MSATLVERFTVRFLVCLGLLLSIGCDAEQETHGRELKLADGTEVPLTVHPARGSHVLIWLPSEAGQNAGEARVAVQLARRGVEVWRADLLAARFLAPVPSALDQIPAGDVVGLISEAARKTRKAVVLISAGHGAAVALRGAQAYRATRPKTDALLGIVLLHPNLYVATPSPGAEAEYLAVVHEPMPPIVILQPDRSPLFWYRARLQALLEAAGTRVRIDGLTGVRDRFHFRPDATAAEDAEAARLPLWIIGALEHIENSKR